MYPASFKLLISISSQLYRSKYIKNSARNKDQNYINSNGDDDDGDDDDDDNDDRKFSRHYTQSLC